jgi:hypothetical protein
MSDGTTHVEDEDIVTTWRPDAAQRPSPTATVTDPQDADGVDGDGTDGVDGDSGDADGTDSGDTGDDADGTDS